MLFFLALGLWGLWIFFRKESVGGSYFGALVIGELLFVTQGVLGAVLYFTGHRFGQAVHVLYGLLGVISLPLAYTYVREKDDRREALIYGLVTLFLFGVAIRGMMTGR